MLDAFLVLASGSSRRMELLDQLGVPYLSDPADIDESVVAGETPADYVQRMARQKACTVAARYPTGKHAVLGADTIVKVDDDILGKPRDHFHGLAILGRLSGRSHSVMTAVCLHSAAGMDCELVETRVEFVGLTPAQCESYLATDEPWDKAGAYGIQGMAGAFVRRIEGSYSNVVGLPLCEVWQMLRNIGVRSKLDPVPE